MTTALIDGLGTPSVLLLYFAAQEERVPSQLAAAPPLREDPDDAVEPLLERGLLSETELAGLFELTPMGYALQEEILSRWTQLHEDMRAKLIAHLVALFNPEPRIIRALQAVDRTRFVPDERRVLADLDLPVPTGVGEMTTSAPHAILAILEAVDPQPGERVLVCGAKGGVTLALAAHLVGDQGRAMALDWEPRTVAHVRRALAEHPELASRADCVQRADVTLGLDDAGPWDVVVFNGSTPKVPWPLVDQLDDQGGRLLCFLQEPTSEGQSCYVLHKNRAVVRDEVLSRFVFTPIYGRYGWDRLADVQAAWEQAQHDLAEERAASD